MKSLLLLLLLGGCTVVEREQIYYTRAEVDAINARSECRLLARSLLQISRCETR